MAETVKEDILKSRTPDPSIYEVAFKSIDILCDKVAEESAKQSDIIIMTNEELIQKAMEARNNSYSPYSNYKVGAALLTKSGKVFLGCNVENCGYGPSNCAERSAIFSAVSNGERDFAKIAIVENNHRFFNNFSKISWQIIKIILKYRMCSQRA